MSMMSPVSSSSSGPTPGSSGVGSMTQNDFLNLMVAQLQNQDPLNPVSTDSFLQEMAAFTEVVDLQHMLSLQTEQTSFSLLGRTVAGTDPKTGQTVQGTVTAVNIVQGQPFLTIGQSQIPLSQVTSVSG